MVRGDQFCEQSAGGMGHVPVGVFADGLRARAGHATGEGQDRPPPAVVRYSPVLRIAERANDRLDFLDAEVGSLGKVAETGLNTDNETILRRLGQVGPRLPLAVFVARRPRCEVIRGRHASEHPEREDQRRNQGEDVTLHGDLPFRTNAQPANRRLSAATTEGLVRWPHPSAGRTYVNEYKCTRIRLPIRPVPATAGYSEAVNVWSYARAVRT